MPLLALSGNQTLTSLRIECQIKGEVFEELSGIMRRNKTLRLLEIGNCRDVDARHPIHEMWPSEFISGIAVHNRSLRFLRIDCTGFIEYPLQTVDQMGSTYSRKWMDAISKNRGIEIELFAHDHVTDSLPQNACLKPFNRVNWVGALVIAILPIFWELNFRPLPLSCRSGNWISCVSRCLRTVCVRIQIPPSFTA